MAKQNSLFELIKKSGANYVDLRFTDPRGKLQHMTQHVDLITEEALEEGIMFDASSIAGWQAIHESDMILKPDAETAVLDPFYAEPTVTVICNVYDPVVNRPYPRCPRSIAKRAEAYFVESDIGSKAFFGPEMEFFIFDNVRFSTAPTDMFFNLESIENPSNSGKDYPQGNSGHRPRTKGGYFPVNPVDTAQDLRTEMLSVASQMGISVEKHHHEVAAAQHEIGIRYNTLLKAADNVQTLKYIVHNVAAMYGKTATFMPKPIVDDNGSGMHVHQSLWRGNTSLFSGNEYAGLSDTALYYIGGIIKHAKALNVFTNPSTNSYKRLVPGYEAPVFLGYAARNRSAACRIPYTNDHNSKRVEVRFPDCLANPYLAFAALLMAGLDGIRNQIDPGKAAEENLFSLPPSSLAKIPTICRSLDEAVAALDEDNAFLLEGDVFSVDLIGSYIALKREEIDRLNRAPHPVEFDLYYSA
ncbi:MAG: type I glutamate--ammonia ligase [Alphaproteobacteria bacterium]|nr:type I glutamate--ammonia ligase [Alphaproteobacteria bacterium]